MDANRSQIVDPGTDAWNKSLLEQAADLTCGILVTDWLKRFEADAYLALQAALHSERTYYSKLVFQGLRERDCWPTRKRSDQNGRGLAFAMASDIVVPITAELDGLLSHNRYLDPRLASSPKIYEMVSLPYRKSVLVKPRV